MSWLIVILVVIAVIAVGALVYEQGRSAALKRRFGPEYDRAVETQGGRRPAEAGLRDILRRRHTLDIKPLPAPTRMRYEQQWREIQLRFVDEPAETVRQGGALVAEVLRERGYPIDPEERVAMLSADHPELLANYRTAQGAQPTAGVEPLRQAFVHYRDVFERLVESPVTSPEAARTNVDASDSVRPVRPVRPGGSVGPGGLDRDEDERPSRFASAYGTVLRAAKRVDPAGRRIALRRRDRESASEPEPSDR
jgi:hypothetical protein